MRTAILFTGTAYNFRYSVLSLMANLVIPNDADVFILTSRYNMQRRTKAGDIPSSFDSTPWHQKTLLMERLETELNPSDIDCIRAAFGTRLKVISFIEDMPDYEAYLSTQREAMKIEINTLRAHPKTYVPFGSDVTDNKNNNIRCVVDQYNHVKKCYELMEQYELTNEKYDYVMRARMDFVCPFEFNLSHYYLGRDSPALFLCGSYKDDPMEWADEFCFFVKRPITDMVFKSLNRMGFLKTDLNTTHNGNEYIFAPETQFSILLHELKVKVINVKIYRSAKFTNAGLYDYMNYMFWRKPLDIEYEYKLSCEDLSDIYEHLPILREYAEKCNHITELGTRYGNSTVAFMAAKKSLITYDVQHNDKIDYLIMVAKENDLDFEFKLEDPKEIEETDLLFIDTNHHAEQCSEELRLHADKARKFIAFHDTSYFWEKGQGHLSGGGLRYAIEPFMRDHPEWKQVYRSEANNGLLILERVY